MKSEQELLQKALIIIRKCGLKYFEVTFGSFSIAQMYWGSGSTTDYHHYLFGRIPEVICDVPYPQNPEGLARNPVWVELESALIDGKKKDRERLLDKLERKIKRVLRKNKMS